jgi:hypothetical protein
MTHGANKQPGSVAGGGSGRWNQSAGNSLVSDFSKIYDPTKAAASGTAASAMPSRSVIFGGSALRAPWAGNT